MFLSTLLVASFTYLFVNAAPVAAVDATWSGDDISYSGDTYQPFDRSDASGLNDIPNDAQIYRSVSGSTAKMIWYESGAVPASEKEANYIQYTLNPPNAYSNPTGKTTITATPTSATATDNGGETACALEGIGWIICPVTQTLAKAMDAIYAAVSAFLVVSPLQTTDQGAMYRMWSLMRNIANVCFIIATMIVIYSHLTNVGLSNYNLKKMLPRLFIAAILVNVSYWICAIAVDISNVLGYAVQDLFISVRNTMVGSEGNNWNITWEAMAAFLLSGGTIAAGAGIGAYLGATTLAPALLTGGAIWIFVPILLSVLFVVLVTFLILAARQAIITVLIVLAPLAFVAFLLPNTEKWFDKWRGALFTLLLLFPAFSLIFGGAQLAASLIIQNAQGPNALNMIILAMGVQVAPLAITPLLLKLGGGALNRFAAIVNNPTKGVFDRGKNYARERSAVSQANGMAALSERAKRRGFVDGRPPRSTRATRLGRFRENAGNRFNPMNAAYNREYSRREREGMKSANEAMTEGIFAQSAAANRIYARTQDAGLEKHAGENSSFERYQRALAAGTSASDVYRRGLHHQAHIDKSAGDIFEGSLNAHSERNFQAQLNQGTTPYFQDLRNRKVQTSVDKGVAEMNVKEIDASGKQAFQREVFGDRDLKAMNVRTVRLEKEAGTIENVLKQRAEDNWERTTTVVTDPEFNSDLRNLRLQESEAGQSLERSKKQWTELVENIAAQGANAPTIVTNADKTLAGNMQQVSKDISYVDRAIQEAKLKQNENLMSDFKASQEAILDPTKFGDPEILRRAAGIGGTQGQTRIYAQATKAVVDAAVQEVKDDRYLLSQYTRSQLHSVLFNAKGINGETVSTEMQQAAMYELLQKKGNNDDAQIIRNAVRDMGMVVDEDSGEFYEPQRDGNGRVMLGADNRPLADKSKRISDAVEVGKRRDWQQFFTDAAKDSPHSMVTLSGTDRSDAEAGTLLSGVQDGFMRDALGGKFGPDKMLKADIDELKFLYTDMTSPDGEYAQLSDPQKTQVNKTITDAIVALQKHPTYKGQIDDRNRGVMNQIVAFADPSYSGGVDADGKPMFFVDKRDRFIIPAPSSPTGDESTFSAPVRGKVPIRHGNDWQIDRTW